MATRSLVVSLLLVVAAPAAGRADCLVDQVQDTWNSTSGGFRWQSFTAGDSGALCRIDLDTASGQDGVTLEIYDGEGTMGTLLHQQLVDLPGGEVAILVNGPVSVDAGSVYTIHSPDIPAWRLQTGDPYAGGVGNINPDVDFWFRTYVDPMGSVPVRPTTWGRVKSVFR